MIVRVVNYKVNFKTKFASLLEGKEYQSELYVSLRIRAQSPSDFSIIFDTIHYYPFPTISFSVANSHSYRVLRK